MIPLANRYWACLLTTGFCAACSAPDATVAFYAGEDYRFSEPERNLVEDIAEATAIEARHVLPSLPADLVIRVYPGKDVIPETGETGTVLPPTTVVWLVDPGHEGGVSQVATSWLRASLLHEFHHLVRSQTITSRSMMDEVISEGMATVFERDVARVMPPWGRYPDNVADWVNELSALPAGADINHWVRAMHPDGRRWIGMRAGTYLVDRAIALSGRTAAELVSATTDEVLGMVAGAPVVEPREP